MDYIIDHRRFKKKFTKNELNNYLYKKDRIIQFPRFSKNYYNFFNNYAKKNYKLINNSCLCGAKDDILLSQTDRHCVEFVTVVCKNCGLIRAKDYFRNEDIEDFYKNFYRTVSYTENFKQLSPTEFFEAQKKTSRFKYELLDKYKIKSFNNLKIVDVGGGAGGVLEHFSNNNEKYLIDYFDPFLRYAETRGIKSIKGGIDKINFIPVIIILSHVIEHWNNFFYKI